MTVGVRKLFEKTSGLKEGGSGDSGSTSAAQQTAKSDLDRATDDLQDLIDNQQSYNTNQSDGTGTCTSGGHPQNASSSPCASLLADYEKALQSKNIADANKYQEQYRECLQQNATKPTPKT